MLGEIFYWILNVSILGSVAGLMVLFLRRIRGLPRFAIYLLWGAPFLRFWLAVGIANKYSLLNFISRYTMRPIAVWESAPSTLEFSMMNSIQVATDYFPIEYKTDLLKAVFNTVGMIWIIIAIGAIFSSVLLYVYTKSALKEAECLKENIYRSDKLLSPAVYGILKPKIVLSMNIADGDLEYILKHEQVHIRRQDNLWRAIAVFTACIHWFNPLIWIFLKYFFVDMEIACDAGVLKQLEESDKKAYATALLSCSAGKAYYASALGGAKTKLRIENILSYKKLTLISTICSAAFFILIIVLMLTNAIGG